VEQELKTLFIQICEALGMQNDPLMYLYVNDSIDQFQQEFLAIFNKILEADPHIKRDIARDKDARAEWVSQMQIQAIYIFSEFLAALIAIAPLQKNNSVKYPSERQKIIQQNIEKLTRYARTLKSKKGNLSIDDLKIIVQEYKKEDAVIVHNNYFKSAVTSVFKKNIQVVNLKIKEKQPGLKTDSIVTLTKEHLDAAQLFLMSLSDETIYGYSKELLDTIKSNINIPSVEKLTSQQREMFFKGVQQRLDFTEGIELISGLVALMEQLNVTTLESLLALEHPKKSLFQQFLSVTNKRPKLSKKEKNDLSSEPVLLFNVLMKLVMDNVTENLNDGSLEKGYKDRYFSDKGLVFPKQKLFTMYTNVLKALDYRLHVSSQQFVALKSATYPRPRTTHIKSYKIIFTAKLSNHEIEATKLYKETLQALADYANFVKAAAVEAMAQNAENNNPKLHAYIKELEDISRQLSTVKISDNTKVTIPMGRTLIKFTERVMAISKCVEEELNKESPMTQWFADHNLGFINKIINAISRLFAILMNGLGFSNSVEVPKRLGTCEDDHKRQKVIHKVQKIRL
jgi:hypothetical protein